MTAVHDKDGWLGALEVFQPLACEGSLTLRVWQSLPADHVDELAGLGIRGGLGDPMLRIGYLKAFMDGTLGSQTARMLDGSGVEITSREELEEIVRGRALRAGRWPSTRSATSRTARRSMRSRRPSRAGSGLGCGSGSSTRSCWRPRTWGASPLGVTASVQFCHATSDRDVADRFWAGKLDGAYAFRSLWDSGAVVANGSDAPIEELDPLAGIVRASCGRSTTGPRWHPEQALTVEQALQATCVTPAWLSYDERRRGKLVPGYLRRPRRPRPRPVRAPPEELADVQVVATMLGGRWTHNPPPWD